MSVDAPVIVLLEGTLWTPGEEWRAAVDHLADRFRRAHPIDAAAVLGAGPLAAQAAQIAAWAAAASIDADAELARFLDQNLSRFVRPVPERTRALRTIAGCHEVHLASALPPSVATSIARHCGVLRNAASIIGDLYGATDLAQLGTRLGAEAVISDEAALRDVVARCAALAPPRG